VEYRNTSTDAHVNAQENRFVRTGGTLSHHFHSHIFFISFLQMLLRKCSCTVSVTKCLALA
jgi:hypothetical protein